MRMYIWMVVMVPFGVAVSADGKDHNHDAHKALCDLMKAAVAKWGSSGEGLSEAMKKALGRTIFGKESGGETLESLRSKLPDDYDNVLNEPGSRGRACGQPRNTFGEDYPFFSEQAPVRWSGHSAPHDMVCLCTAGSHGWPLNETQKATTLCGKDKVTLKAEGNKGWGGINGGPTREGKEQINAAWFGVTVPCLQGSGEQGETLKDAMKNFIVKLDHKTSETYRNMYLLGEGNISSEDACNGNGEVCVKYFPNTTHSKTWWQDLQTALDAEEAQKRLAEEEKRNKQENEQKKELPKNSHLLSEPPKTNQTEAPNKDNITDTIRRFNLTSDTPIIPPSSWLLSVAILI